MFIGVLYQYKSKLALEGSARITILGLKDADCILLQQEDKTILIDTGRVKDRELLIQSMRDAGIEQIDYMILSHPDKDHIGGAEAILSAFQVKHVIQSHFQKGSELQQSLELAMQDQNLVPEAPRSVTGFTCGEFKVTIYPPEKESYDNDYSLLVLIEHGDVSMLFPGDAEGKRLKEAMNYSFPRIDLYKVAHHGRDSKNAVEFLELIRPRYAVVTSDHADQRIKDCLKKLHTITFYSGRGDIHFTSDGRTLVPKT